MSPRSAEMMAAAARLFAAKGFYGVTVDDIGAAVGLSGPALYHHFSSKEALLGEMLVTVSEELLARAKETESLSPTGTLRHLVAGQITFSLDQPELITVHHRDLVHAPEAVQRGVRHLQAEYVEYWVGALCELGVSNQLQARAAVHAVIGLINSTPFSMRLTREAMFHLLREMSIGALSAFLIDNGVAVDPFLEQQVV